MEHPTAPGANPAAYEIRSCERLIYQAISGRLTLDEVWRLNDAFWRAWQPQFECALMDYRGVAKIDLTVAEFKEAGFSEQARLGPPRQDRMRAAYVVEDPVVFGFARVIQGVWKAYADVAVFESLTEALDWLGVSEGVFANSTFVSRG